MLSAHDCKIAPATYYAHHRRQVTPSARTVRDAEPKEHISEVFEANYRVYGARKIWRELNRQGHAVARCTVERLMRELGITGAVRGRRVITTLPGGQFVSPSTGDSSPCACRQATTPHPQVLTMPPAFIVRLVHR
ncbi:IS3 family transposase [Streptomyces sp. NPDC018972]|uniref:IS3 family transposase n=1 Tax=Streptomyces sp. NPDC018972 TaxID=3365060 RepID=UPI00378EF3E8